MNHQLHTIYTAQYRYSGPDRVDITVKGQDPNWKEFAPTWDMVMGVKNGTMTKQRYVELYHPSLDNTSIIGNVSVQTWKKLLDMETATFVCFCPQLDFCHRNILVNYLVNAFGDRITNGGFRTSN